MRTAVVASALLAAVALTPGAAVAAEVRDPGSPVPPVTPSVSDVSTETVKYGSRANQDMDVWWTPTGAKRPGVFLIHGGWWSSGDKRHMTEITRAYAELGYTVFNVNYRLSGQASWPAQRTDAFGAIKLARKHAERWSFDPMNYVLVGFSAGGHLATAVGTYGNGVPGLKGVVGLSPVISPLRAYTDGAGAEATPHKRRLREAAIRLAGGCEPKGRCSRVWASMEVPWHASRNDAPMLLMHSQDEFVPPVQSQLLKNMLGPVGVDVTLFTNPGSEHSAPLYRLPGVAERVQAWIASRIG
ncbi:alpha/beta hydrolase [Nonomuraea longicatena]|uniref:BD-FAE-like domain-containing protein n=1 Tax=Nonomuraea longicatena TaxID=83682 RepID=A0ABN1R154_9ACTN